jgi:hypothetical protein
MGASSAPNIQLRLRTQMENSISRESADATCGDLESQLKRYGSVPE